MRKATLAILLTLFVSTTAAVRADDVYEVVAAGGGPEVQDELLDGLRRRPLALIHRACHGDLGSVQERVVGDVERIHDFRLVRPPEIHRQAFVARHSSELGHRAV